MKRLLIVAFAAALVLTLWSIEPAGADHDFDPMGPVYSPCAEPSGYTHMTYDEFDAAIQQRVAEGRLPESVVFRSDGSPGAAPAGVILSLSSFAGVEDIYWKVGLLSEWYIDGRTGKARHYLDPAWGDKMTLTPSFTIWQSQCWGAPLEPLPHPPCSWLVTPASCALDWSPGNTTTTTTTPPVTTTAPPATTTAPPVTTTTTIAPSSTVAPSSTTTVILTTATTPPTTTQVVATTLPPEPPPPEEVAPIPEPLPPADTPDGYDRFDAEWDGYPFEQTVLLLEERYPPGTPDRFHFRLSVAVEFLRQGGMVKGLDNLWESG